MFDFVVVFLSLAAIALENLPGFNLLRLMRVFRILLIFRRLQPLRQVPVLVPPSYLGTRHSNEAFEHQPRANELSVPSFVLLQIVTALTMSIPSVCYAFTIHLTLTCMYAILAVHIYGGVRADLFGNFLAALFTVRKDSTLPSLPFSYVGEFK